MVIIEGLKPADLKIGDVVLGFQTDSGWHGRSGARSWKVARVNGSAVYVDDLGDTKWLGAAWNFKVRRATVLVTHQPVVNAVADLGPRKIPDWPLPCPSCKRPDSAVLLFMGYDCKHGCYK